MNISIFVNLFLETLKLWAKTSVFAHSDNSKGFPLKQALKYRGVFAHANLT
jgi:hypothetical protein